MPAWNDTPAGMLGFDSPRAVPERFAAVTYGYGVLVEDAEPDQWGNPRFRFTLVRTDGGEVYREPVRFPTRDRALAHAEYVAAQFDGFRKGALSP